LARIDPAAATAATVSLGQTVAAFTFFLPKLSEVRQAARDDSLVRGDVRLGQVAATALAVGVGLMMYKLSDSIAPVTIAVLTSLIVGAIYEVAMDTERLFENDA
jgi:undecaprenyl pyrophosphate phosphatase UppP